MLLLTGCDTSFQVPDTVCIKSGSIGYINGSVQIKDIQLDRGDCNGHD